MNQPQPTAGSGVALQPISPSSALLPARWLWPVRAVLALVAALALAIFLVGVQLDSAQYRTICTGAVCADGQLTLDSARTLLALHISLDDYAMINIVLLLVQALVYYGLAALIAWHKSDEWLVVCVVVGFLAAPTNSLAQPIAAAPPVWLTALAFAQFLGVATFVVTCFVFPDGRFVPRWTLPIAAAGLVVVGIQSFLPDVVWPPLLAGVNWVGAFTLLAFSQIYRYRKVSSHEQRQQTKWFVLGLTLAVMVEMVNRLLPLLYPSLSEPGSLDAFVLGTLSAFGFLLIPLTIGFAILRYRLWDIDIIINRTLVYGALTASVVGLYVLVVGYLGALLRTEGGSNLAISLVATGLVAVLFQPWRALLQRGANRLLYGQRDEPYAVITRLSQRLESTLAPDAVLSTIVETVAQALKLPYAAILWKQEETLALAASYGHPAAEPVTLPLVYQGETVGQLQLAPRARGEGFTPADMRLLDELARQVGLATHAVRLATDLQHSRERLVVAHEEERRRLRRDLHDTVGPTLASLVQRIDAACHLITNHPEAAIVLLENLKAQVKSTIADIRRVVYALRPPVLDELGLVSAIQQQLIPLQETEGLCISVEAPAEMPELSAAVEVAAYHIALEALTNVKRHAQAENCLVHLDVADERTLCLSISDDGRGLANDYHAGVGITSMRERVAELGGTFTLTSQPGGGTRIQVHLPLKS